MRNISPNFLAALSQSREKGLEPRRFLFIQAKRIDEGSPASSGFWTGDDNINISVISPITGNLEARQYYGAQNLSISPIARNSKLETEEIEATLNNISIEAQTAVRGYDLRLAKAEIHEIIFNGREPVSAPEPVFLGEIDAAPINTPEVGSEGNISITMVSDAISMLSISNPLLSSFEGQKIRNVNDTFGIFASTLSKWDIPWGKKQK